MLSHQKQPNDDTRQSHVENYIYDAADNLLETLHHSKPIIDNRLVHYQNEYYNYNDWGELKTIHQDDSKRIFKFNDSGELIESYHHSENTDSHGIYDYDALGRRIRKTVETTKEGLTTTTKTKFVWMGMQMVEESIERQACNFNVMICIYIKLQN